MYLQDNKKIPDSIPMVPEPCKQDRNNDADKHDEDEVEENISRPQRRTPHAVTVVQSPNSSQTFGCRVQSEERREYTHCEAPRSQLDVLSRGVIWY